MKPIIYTIGWLAGLLSGYILFSGDRIVNESGEIILQTSSDVCGWEIVHEDMIVERYYTDKMIILASGDTAFPRSEIVILNHK